MKLAAPVLIGLLTIPTVSNARTIHGGRAPDGFDGKQDRREVRYDRRDLVLVEGLLARFDAAARRSHRTIAAARRSHRTIAAVESDVLRFLDREIREAQLELARSRQYARRYGRNHRDDRRDLVRVKAIRHKLSSLRGRIDRRSLKRKRGLLAELVKLERTEMREGREARR